MMENKTIGIIGAGAIGKCLAEYAESHLNRFINQLILFDSDIDKMKTLADKLNNVEIATSMKDLVEKSDLVIEAASAGAVSAIFENVLREGKDLMVMSIGGLLGNEDYLDMARNKGLIVILPSGAIAAI
ncbi:MAG: saccharopine dehydrogenase NADP-binding domain-containing protein, partial [Candidatus Omnitrophica bacterium]|nr:saccharopine dehydrogenase NADP-binding domain-containing protein [Candidatus Omnitrophota bacterium]